MPKLEDVFGVHTEPVLSYVHREQVDDRFEVAMLKGHQHMVVYGSSKQGKTSLRQTYIPDSRCVIVRCSPRMSLESIYQSILRQSNIRIETFLTGGDEAAGKISAKIGFRAFLPWVGGGDVEGASEFGGKKQRTLTTEFVSHDFGDAQSVGELLQEAKFDRFIVLENFHYLPQAVQKELAFDLKTYHEIGVRFVVLGIWREANLLTTHNSDLQDRVVEIPVEPWETEDFDRIVEKGCHELQIEILAEVVDLFKDNAYGNVGLFQEFLKEFLLLNGVNETCSERRMLDDPAVAKAALEHKLESQRGQLLNSLKGIAAQCRIRRDEKDPLLLPYYLVQIILETKVGSLQEGIERSKLLDGLRKVHHRTDKETIRASDVTNLLQGLPRLQKDINPPFLYYDSNSKRLRVVDTRQFFVLSRTPAPDLLEEIPHPLSAV